MTTRTRFYVDESPKPLGPFSSREECVAYFKSNKLLWDESKLITVKTEVEAFNRSVEESTKQEKS